MNGTLRIYLVVSSLLEVLAELENEQLIEERVYEENGSEVKCALCYGDKVILTECAHGVAMEYMEGAERRQLPAGISRSQISAITLSGVVLPPEITSAAYEHWSKKTFALAVRYLTAGDDEPDPKAVVTISWRFLSKSDDPGEIFELLEAIVSRQIAPQLIDGIDYAAGATLEYLNGDSVMQHVLEGIGTP